MATKAATARQYFVEHNLPFMLMGQLISHAFPDSTIGLRHYSAHHKGIVKNLATRTYGQIMAQINAGTWGDDCSRAHISCGTLIVINKATGSTLNVFVDAVGSFRGMGKR